MLNISFTSLETKDSVLIVLGKSNVRLGDFQVDNRVSLKVGRRIRNFSKSQKPRPSYLKCGINVEIVICDGKCGCNTLEYFLRNWELIFFHPWKETSSTLQNPCKPKILKNRNWPMMINLVRSQV